MLFVIADFCTHVRLFQGMLFAGDDYCKNVLSFQGMHFAGFFIDCFTAHQHRKASSAKKRC